MRMEEILCSPYPAVRDITNTLATEQPEAAEFLARVAAECDNKHYYEMTLALEAALKVMPAIPASRLLVATLAPMVQRLKPFSIAVLVDDVALRFDAAKSARQLTDFFISAIKSAESPTAGPAEKQALREATLLLRVTAGALAVKEGDLVAAQQILLHEVGKQVTAATGVAPQLSARLHRACSRLFKAATRPGSSVTMKPQEMYNALSLYLAYQRLDALSQADIEEVARDFVVSGMLSPQMFDFGEMRDARVVAGLAEEDKWLRDLVAAAASSDVAAFRDIAAKNADKAKILFDSEGMQVLEVKLRVSLLLDLCFSRSVVTNEEIMAKCAVADPEAAARLFMKAAGAGVLQGRADGHTGEFYVDWVLPRAADEQRMKEMAEGLRQWGQRIRALEIAAQP